MVAVYASTSPGWFRYLAELVTTPPQVAFWRPTRTRAKQIAEGEPWFFKEWGTPRILGYGRFVRYEATTPSELWRNFEVASGAPTEQYLLAEIEKARREPTPLSANIGNVVLDDFTVFPTPIPIADVGLENLTVPFRYVPPDSTIMTLVQRAGKPRRLRQEELRRLPADELNKVTSEHIWNALQRLRFGDAIHDFGESTDYDVVCDDGQRLPPKAVFGVAATEALGYQVLPIHFSGGLGTLCFRALEASGLSIVPKGTGGPSDHPSFPVDREWTEGGKTIGLHLRAERASGLGAAKKAEFKRIHGKLFCERCGFEPSEYYEPTVAEACIEAHHSATLVKDMVPEHRTKLDDLQCLCANCHRVTHRELKLAQER